MNDLKWFFPESSSECLELFKKGFRPHGGGTFLIKTSLNIPGLFDISRVSEYRKASAADGHFMLGSALSYFEASTFVAQEAGGNLFSKALSSAASTPLRNRISIGGSLYALPKWSDVAAPLAASDGLILFEGGGAQTLPEYLADSKNKRDKLISAIRIPSANIKGDYYRFGLTSFDYPFFTVAVSIRRNGRYQAAVSGTKARINVFSGSSAEIITSAEDELSFGDERGLGGDYIRVRAIVELRRLLEATENRNE